MHPRPFTFAALLVGCVASKPFELASSTRPPGPSAEIDRTSARFVFPAESAAQFTWRLPAAAPYVGRPEHAWEVQWEPDSARYGRDPDEILVLVSWDSGGTRRGALHTLLADARIDVLTFCLPCQMPAGSPSRDAVFAAPALHVRAEGAHPVVTVAGAAAVRRLFPVVPDSVRLVRRWPDGAEQEVTVAVRRR